MWGIFHGTLLFYAGVLCAQRGGRPRPHRQQVAGLGFKPRQSGSKAHSLSTKPGCLGGVPGKMALGFALLLLPPGVSAVMACHVVGVRQVASGRNSEVRSLLGWVSRTHKHSRGPTDVPPQLRWLAGGGGRAVSPRHQQPPSPPPPGEDVRSQPQGKPWTSGILIHRSRRLPLLPPPSP